MQGTYTMEYALFPYEAGKSADAFALGYGYQHDLAAVETGMNRTTEQIYMPQAQTGILPLEKSFFEWQGEGLNLTAWKKGAHSDDIFVRFVNTMEKDVTLTIKKADWMKCMYRSNVIEEENEALGAASYKVTHTCENGRGVYSFCMCPGGYVVNASSEEGMLAVNGMSYQARDSKNANSALIVTVSPEDFPEEGVLGGITFQRNLEKAAWELGKGRIPVQLFEDFKDHRKSTEFGEVVPQMKGAYVLADVRSILPKEIGDSIEEGVTAFGRKIKGFDRPDALLSGIESRTSSPVRIVRDRQGCANIEGIYPCGEGAGYAGGITSAAMDGIKTAEFICEKFKNF